MSSHIRNEKQYRVIYLLRVELRLYSIIFFLFSFFSFSFSPPPSLSLSLSERELTFELRKNGCLSPRSTADWLADSFISIFTKKKLYELITWSSGLISNDQRIAERKKKKKERKNRPVIWSTRVRKFSRTRRRWRAREKKKERNY